jgi:hypothetical protein
MWVFGWDFPCFLVRLFLFSKQSSDKFSRQSPKTKESQQQKVSNKKSATKSLNIKVSTGKKAFPWRRPQKEFCFQQKQKKKRKKFLPWRHPLMWKKSTTELLV